MYIYGAQMLWRFTENERNLVFFCDSHLFVSLSHFRLGNLPRTRQTTAPVRAFLKKFDMA